MSEKMQLPPGAKAATTDPLQPGLVLYIVMRPTGVADAQGNPMYQPAWMGQDMMQGLQACSGIPNAALVCQVCIAKSGPVGVKPPLPNA